ncbi:hypothetical protein [Devosia sp.]|uniref:hypothetical protein n=1 Tax=Devosia sp. TaxID=1871048 RepID=UPI0019FE7B4D|nr:hypothetical protein [Devosia sp.]MBE0580143.1 hypothetical protein [Devosia sp.]
MAEGNLFKPIPEKYLPYPDGEHDWRDVAEGVVELMERRHKRVLADPSKIDVLGLTMMATFHNWKESELYRNSPYGNVAGQLRGIKNIFGTAIRLRKFAVSDDNRGLKRTLSEFYQRDPARAEHDENVQFFGADPDAPIGELAEMRPEWLFGTAGGQNWAFYEWLNGAAHFVAALEDVRRQLELTDQFVPIELYSLIGGRFPELYRELYGSKGGGRQGGDVLTGPLYTFVAEVARLAMGKKPKADAIAKAIERWNSD